MNVERQSGDDQNETPSPCTLGALNVLPIHVVEIILSHVSLEDLCRNVRLVNHELHTLCSAKYASTAIHVEYQWSKQCDIRRSRLLEYYLSLNSPPRYDWFHSNMDASEIPEDMLLDDVLHIFSLMGHDWNEIRRKPPALTIVPLFKKVAEYLKYEDTKQE